MIYTEARKRADKTYQKKIHKMTVVFKPEDEWLWDEIHRVAGEEGVSPFVIKILKEFVHDLPTDFENA